MAQPHLDNPPRSFIDILDWHLGCEGVQTVVGFWDRRRQAFEEDSQRAFFRRAVELGAWLADRGVHSGDAIAIAAPAPRDVLSGFVAAIAIGAQPAVVPLRVAFDPPDLLRRRTEQVIDALGEKTWLLADRGRADTLEGLARPGRFLEIPASLPEAVEPMLPADVDPDAPCFYQLTSGSTALPKPVVITHRNVIANLGAMCLRLEGRTGDRMVSWLPLYHDMGLAAVSLGAIVNGFDLYLMSPFDFLSDPVSWLRAMSGVGGTITAGPTFAYELAAQELTKAGQEVAAGLDLSALRCAAIGAEPVSATVVHGVVSSLGRIGLRPEALRPAFGMAEGTVIVTMTEERTPPSVLDVDPDQLRLGMAVTGAVRRPLAEIPELGGFGAVSLGPPVDGFRLWLRDEHGDLISEELTCGELVITGSSVSPGYLTPDGALDGIPAAGFPTGDLGLICDGELYVVDRLKNVIIRHGSNHAVAPMEETLATAMTLAVSRVVVLDSDLDPGKGLVTAVVELPKARSAAELVAAARSVQGEFELPLDELVLVRQGTLPQTTSGKKRHAETRRQLRDGDLRVVERVSLHGWTPIPLAAEELAVLDLDEIDALNRVRRMVLTAARRRGFTGELRDDESLQHDLAFDSVTLYEVAVAIEESEAVRIPEEALTQLRTVEDLCSLVRRLRAGEEPESTGISGIVLELAASLPQTLVVVDDQVDRVLRVGERTVIDFASANYLGFDLEPEIQASVAPLLERWGVHPSWTRAVASPRPYADLEAGLAALIGAPDTLVFPTLTLLHLGLLPMIAGSGTLLIDAAAHHSMQEAAELAGARGATVITMDQSDGDAVATLLRSAPPGPRVIVVDGVYSTGGYYADLPRLVALAERHDAVVYVDDAHGFGVIGEQPSTARPWGSRGNGVVRHFGLGYERIIYTAGLSKAYSSMAAFVSCRTPDERLRYATASTAVFSGPVPTASLASALAGLTLNAARGDEIRDALFGLTAQLLNGARGQGFHVENDTGFPIVTVVLGPPEAVRRGCELLWEDGLLITPAVFPAAPLARGGVRFTVTAANTEEQVAHALGALARIRDDLPCLPGPGSIYAESIHGGSARGGS